MATKKLVTYFPKDYPEFTVIKKFTKKRSPRTRIFATDDPDGWFIDVFEIKTRTGEVVDNEGWIIEKDVESWTSWYNRLGWEEQET